MHEDRQISFRDEFYSNFSHNLTQGTAGIEVKKKVMALMLQTLKDRREQGHKVIEGLKQLLQDTEASLKKSYAIDEELTKIENELSAMHVVD